MWSFLSAYLELFAFHLLSLSGMPHRFTVAFLLAFFLCFFLSILSLRVSLLLSFVLSSRLAAPSISQANETATPERTALSQKGSPNKERQLEDSRMTIQQTSGLEGICESQHR